VLDAQLHFVETIDDLLDLRSWLGERRDFLGIDIETEGLNLGRDKVRMFQFGDPAHGWALPYEWWGGAVRELMGLYDRRMVAHNAMFEGKFLAREGIAWPTHLVHDSMIMCHLVDPMSAVGLKPRTARKYGPIAAAGERALAEAMRKQSWTWATVPITLPAYWMYAALDTILCSKLAEDLWPTIQDQRLVYDVELGAISVMKDAEVTGLRIDLPYVAEKTAWLAQEMDQASADMQVLGVVGPSAAIKNPGSDAQVIAYMQRNGARLWKTTEKGNLSCDDDVLKEQEQLGLHGIAEIRRWRRARWLENSFFSNLRDLNVDGIIRPSVKPVGARTARMSITEPALQTIPRGTLVRDAFIAREGHSLLSADYDQLELRVLAHAANETAMLAAINERGEDLHDFVARSLYGEGFTKEQRQICKNAQFAKIYGAGLDQFARTAGISPSAAQDFLNDYDLMFPGVTAFQQTITQQALIDGYVTTILGRRIPVERGAAYKATNYWTQSSATADLLKLKIIQLSDAGMHDFFRLPIHDEVILEVPDDLVPEVKRDLEEVLTETRLFKARLDAEVVVVKRWGDKSRL
jgi:DNA polymerase-1